MPSKVKARLKAMNKLSRVRFQKRRKNSPAMRKPMVIAPARKLSSISALLLKVPNESEQKNADGTERQCVAQQAKIDLRREHDHVDDDDEIVGGQENKTQRAPKQQPRTRPPIAPRQQPRARRAGQEAEQVDDGRK